MKTAIRVTAAFFIPMYAYFIILQFNDIDAWLWIVAYGIVMAASIATALGMVFQKTMKALAALYFLWTLMLLLQVQGEWFAGEIEREVAGLAICIATFVWYSLLPKRTG